MKNRMPEDPRYRPVLDRPFAYVSGWVDRVLERFRDALPAREVRVYSAEYLDWKLPEYLTRAGEGAATAAQAVDIDLALAAATAYDAGLEITDGVISLRGIKAQKPDRIAEGEVVMEMVEKGYPPAVIAKVRAPAVERTYQKAMRRAEGLNVTVRQYVSAKRVLRAARLLELYRDADLMELPDQALELIEGVLRYPGRQFTQSLKEAALPPFTETDALRETLHWNRREADYLNALEFHMSGFLHAALEYSISGTDLRSLRPALTAVRGCSARANEGYRMWQTGWSLNGLVQSGGDGLEALEAEREREVGRTLRCLEGAEPGSLNIPRMIQGLADVRLSKKIPEKPVRAVISLAIAGGLFEGIASGGKDLEAPLYLFGIAALCSAGKWLPRLAEFVRNYPVKYVLLDGTREVRA
ncbi:MAG TPA: hypothetical protein VJB16_05510 [archaeon]|nr:hypothetical protein [archaeon]